MTNETSFYFWVECPRHLVCGLAARKLANKFLQIEHISFKNSFERMFNMARRGPTTTVFKIVLSSQISYVTLTTYQATLEEMEERFPHHEDVGVIKCNRSEFYKILIEGGLLE